MRYTKPLYARKLLFNPFPRPRTSHDSQEASPDWCYLVYGRYHFFRAPNSNCTMAANYLGT